MHQREEIIVYFETNGYLKRDVGEASKNKIKENSTCVPNYTNYLEDRLLSVSFFSESIY